MWLHIFAACSMPVHGDVFIFYNDFGAEQQANSEDRTKSLSTGPVEEHRETRWKNRVTERGDGKRYYLTRVVVPFGGQPFSCDKMMYCRCARKKVYTFGLAKVSIGVTFFLQVSPEGADLQKKCKKKC